VLPNRLATYAAALGALALGLLPLAGNLDWTSTAGVLGAIAALSAVAWKWLDGWSKYERGIGDGLLPGDELDDDDDLEPALDDEFDEATAPPIPPAAITAAHAPAGTTYAPGATSTGTPPDTRP
jgi:hypothetical protein